MTELKLKIEHLLWSLWAEMGAPGGGRAHRDVVLDPESLIVHTPSLAADDHRLMGVAFDWCVQHADKIWKSRLTGLSKLLPEPERLSLARFNGALEAHGVSWEPRAQPLEVAHQRTTVALPTARPALLIFRLRALTGVSARADVLARLLGAANDGVDVPLLTPAGISRRSIERVIAELLQAGLVVCHGSARRRSFRLRDASSFKKLIDASSLKPWDWQRIFTILIHANRLHQLQSESPGLRRIHAVSISQAIAEQMAGLARDQPPRLEGRKDAFDVLMDWCLRFVKEIGEQRDVVK